MSKPTRKGRPLLVAAAGVAVVSFVQCHRPVGNLKPTPESDAGAPVNEASAPSDTASATQQTPPILRHHPVGNLRPPPPPPTDLDAGPLPHPVGNLRAP